MKNLIYSILRWRSRLYTVAVIVLLLNFSTTSEPKAETWTNYTNANYVQAIAIEGNYVWCGTSGGVVKWNRMDGTYIKYTAFDGLAHNYVIAIAIDIQGNKWFGTSGGVSKFDGQDWTTYTTADGLAYNTVCAIAIDIDGNKWFGTYGGVSKFDGQTWTTYTTADGLGANRVYAIAIDGDGNKWFGTSGGGVSKFDGQTWTTYNTVDGLANNYVNAIAIDGDGNKWFGTSKGVSKFDGQNWTTYTTADGLCNRDVRAITIDTGGNKWFGTNGGGVSKFDGQNWTTYNTVDGLANNYVNAIAIDGDGNKWFGTSGRLSKFDGVNWTTYTTADGPGSNYLLAIVIDGDGNKWFGTNGGGVSKFDGQNWITYRYIFFFGVVHAIAIDGDGNKWFGSSSGVRKFDGQTWTTYITGNSGLADNDVRAIAIDGDGNKWFGTKGGGVSKFDGQTWTTYTTADGLGDNYVNAIAIDGDGNKWFGTDGGGVSKFDGQNWTTYTTADGLANNDVHAIAIDGDDNKWFGTNGGVSKFDGQTWTTYTTAAGLADNYVHAIAIDGDDNKWFGTNTSGVSKFDGQNWTTYTTGNSVLVDNHVYAIAIEAKNDGTKWFGTYGGGVSSLYDGEGYIKYPPVNFMGAVQGPNSIKWTWDEPGSTYGILGYEIKRKEDGGTYQTVADANSLPVGTTYYDDEGLLPNTLYFANISSVYQNRKVPTEDIQRCTLCEVPPAPDVTIGYDGNYCTEIDIVAGNNPSITEYAIFVASGNGTGIGWLDGTGGISGVDNVYKTETGWEDGTSNRHTGLNKGDSYKYAVRARNYDGIKAPVLTNELIYCQTITITGPTPPEAKIDGATLQPVYNDNKTVTFSSLGIGQIVFYYTYTNDGSSPPDPTDIDNDGTGNLLISANDNEVKTYKIKAIAYDETGAPSPVSGPWTVMIDRQLPTNPTTAIDTEGAPDGSWGIVNDCNFTWSGANDGAGSGVDGYYYYWGKELNGTSTSYTTSAGFNPAIIQENVGIYYLRVKTRDKAGNESGWTTLYTVKYDGEAPINPTNVTESGGAPNNAWGVVNDCNFTWSGANDGAGSGVDGYYYYWGKVSNGTSTSYTTSAGFNPAAIQEDLATYYLRVKSKDKVGNESGWTTLYTVKYDGQVPINPTNVTESGGAPNDAWGTVNDCNFTWGGASDGAGSGVDGYYYYWGTVSNGTSASYTTSAGFNPAAIQEDLATYYLRVKSRDKVGNESGWTTLYTVKYDGEAPANPTNVTESGGAPNDAWGIVNDCNFTWGGASDGSGSGIDGYYYYWGKELNGTSTNYTTSAGFNPAAIQEDLATYYLRVKSRDKVGNESAWTTLYTVKYDGEAPINPTNVTESGGAPNNAWGVVNDCNFTWSGASDGSGSGVDGYYYYWGTVSNGTSTNYTTSAGFNPAIIQENVGIYYLRVKTRDKAGNESGWTTLYTVKYDGEAPTNPTTVTENGGASNNIWGIVNDCDFTWGGASDGSGSGIDGYYYYWGTASNGTSTNYTTSAGFDPAAIQEDLATYYLRVKTKDKVGNESGWTTLYAVKYDGQAPINPTNVTESGGALNNVWGTVNDCNFTWSGASDGSGSGIDGYYYYWGTVSNGTSTSYTTSPAFNPAPIQEDSGIYYLRVKTKDKAGNESAWITLYTVKYDRKGPSFSDYSIVPSSDSISITATAEDTAGSGVSEYYFERKEGGANSGWIANNFWSDTGLIPNTLYNYTIKCKDLLGNISNELSVFTYTLCEIPGLEITYVTTDSVDMRITGNNSPETNYAIKGFLIVSGFIEKEGYADPALGRLVLNSDPFWETKENWYKLGASTDTLIISNLIADGEYEFQVKAKNISGETPFSVAVATTTLALGPPDLEITAVDKSTITVKVIKKGLYAEKFVIAISSISSNGPWAYIQEDYTTGADEYSFLFDGANVKEIVCKDLIGFTEYWFRAKAKDATDNESFLGDWVSATTLSGTPVVKLENYEYEEWINTLTFSVKSLQGAKNYYYKVDKSSSVQVTTSDATLSLSTSFIASSEGTWYLNVLGTDGTNPSGRSSYILLVDITAPVANITAEFQNEGLEETKIHSAHEPKFIFPTQENLSGIDGYSYTFSTNANQQPPNPDNDKDTDSNEFVMQFTPANQGGTYYVKVKAKDNAGNWSNVAVFSLNYIPDWTAPEASVNVPGRLEIYGETIGLDTDGTVNVSFDEQIWEGCLRDNIKIIAIRDNEGKSINEESECKIDYDQDKHIAKISPKDGWKKSRKYRFVVDGGIEDKAGNTLGENTESIFTTMLGYKVRNVVMLESDQKTKMTLEPNALKEDGYVSINLEPLPLKTGGAIEATQVNPEAIIEADEKIKNNDDKYSYNLRESMREITGYTGKGDRMVTERFLNSVYVELPYVDADNDGIVDSTQETPVPVKVITLSIYWLDEEHRLWVRVSGTKVDTKNKVARAKVIGFGVYTIMGGGFYDLSEAYAFPVPYKPNDGNYLTGTPGEGITFTNLTNEAEIEIYTITGELVKRLIHKDGNQEEWNPVENEKGEKVVSGVYVYYVENARQHKSGKIMIIR